MPDKRSSSSTEKRNRKSRLKLLIKLISGYLETTPQVKEECRGLLLEILLEKVTNLEEEIEKSFSTVSLRNKPLWKLYYQFEIPMKKMDKYYLLQHLSKSQNPPLPDVDKNTLVEDMSGSPIILFIKNVISKKDLENWENIAEMKAPILAKAASGKRGKHEVVDLGQWNVQGKYSWKQTDASTTDEGRELISALEPLTSAVSSIIRQHLPHVAELYEKLDQKFRMFDLFSYVNLNWTSPPSSHTDDRDFYGGFCAVTTFGQFTGGALNFPHLKLNFNILPGDVILFRSWLLEHGVLPWNGNRKSIVWTTNNDFYNHRRFLTESDSSNLDQLTSDD